MKAYPNETILGWGTLDRDGRTPHLVTERTFTLRGSVAPVTAGPACGARAAVGQVEARPRGVPCGTCVRIEAAILRRRPR